jgi:hypothetical protein
MIIIASSLVAVLGVGCISSRPPDWFDQSLNSVVGKEFEKIKTISQKYYQIITEDDQYKDQQSQLPNGCTYVLRVRKSDDIIISWRYVSAPSLCNHDLDTRSH